MKNSKTNTAQNAVKVNPNQNTENQTFFQSKKNITRVLIGLPVTLYLAVIVFLILIPLQFVAKMLMFPHTALMQLPYLNSWKWGKRTQNVMLNYL